MQFECRTPNTSEDFFACNLTINVVKTSLFISNGKRAYAGTIERGDINQRCQQRIVFPEHHGQDGCVGGWEGGDLRRKQQRGGTSSGVA